MFSSKNSQIKWFLNNFQFVNYPHTMWAKDADGNSILQIKSESDHDLLSQAAASIKQVKNFLDWNAILIH